MTTPEELQRTDVYAILPHPQRNAICLIKTPGGWTLPHITLPESLWIRATTELNAALQARLQLPVITLYCHHYAYDRQNNAEELVYVVENQASTTTLPPDGTWLEPGDIQAADISPAKHASLLAAFLQEREQGSAPAMRPPWSRPGWFREASTWMAAELHALGYELLAPIVQTNSWCLSCILSAPTSRGRVFLKAAPDFPLFVNEPALLRDLSTLFPHNVPTPLSTETSRFWMLLDDFGPALESAATPELRTAMLHQFAHMQQTAARHVPRLLEMGCIDRRLSRLQQQLDGLIGQVEQDGSLADEALQQLRQAAPRLKTMCEQLAAYAIPETLNHGDLHLGNVAQRNGDLLFFDWTDACVAHPFLDMISIFNEKDLALQTRLRDEYLHLWEDYASPHDLRHAWSIAERLSALHQAISFQSILLHLEETPRQAFGNVVPHYIHRALTPLPTHA